MKENRNILKLAIPNIISNITIPLVGIVDIAIIGRLGIDSMIGAMAIGAALFNFVYWSFAFLRMGTSGLVAQSYGARDFGEITSIMVRSLAVALVVALLLVLFRSGVGGALFLMMEGSDEVMNYAKEYFYIRIWAAPATLSLFVFQGWFIGMQNSRFPMYISIIINIINVVLGVWFVLFLGRGVGGVAWAVVIAQYTGLATAIALWIIYYSRFIRHINIRSSINIIPLIKFFAVNRDIFLRTLLIVVVYTFFTAASSTMGDTVLAANSLLMQLFTLFSYMLDGFAYAGESLIGRWAGARNQEKLNIYLRKLFFWSAAVAILFFGVYALFWRDILLIFTSSEAIISEAAKYMTWMLIIPIVSFMPFLFDGALIGATQTHTMRNNMFFSAVLFFATYYALREVLGNDALWLAYVLFIVARGVIYFFQNRYKIVLSKLSA